MERPNYPFNDLVANNEKRHHIIPWAELISAGEKHILSNKEYLRDFLTGYKFIKDGRTNLGGFTNVEKLIEEISNNNREALETFRELLAWVPGNLIIGPASRGKDPENKFDSEALNIMKSISADTLYQNLEKDWEDSVKQKDILMKFSKKGIENGTIGKWKKG